MNQFFTKAGVLLCFLSFVFFLLLTCAQNTPENKTKTKVADIEALKQALERLEQDPLYQHGMVAFSLVNQEGTPILELNAQKTLTVASVMKAITTATALAVLGENFKFETSLAYSGNIENGVLKGDLFIKGGGDPSLGSNLMKGVALNELLAQFTQKIKAIGIQKIQGRIIADESLFTYNLTPEQWIWGDMGNYFGTPAGAINVLDNTYKLFFQPTKLGQVANILRTEPEIPYLRFINEVKTAEAGTGDQASISGAPYDPVRYVTGTIPLGGVFSIKGSIPDPAYYLAYQLHQKLNNSQVSIAQMPITTHQLYLDKVQWDTQRTLIYTHQSASLKDIVAYTNLYSINLFAEALLKAIALKTIGEASTQAGVQAVVDFWKKQGINTEGFFMHDGSGLAYKNSITATQLTSILSNAAQSDYGKTFLASLPIAGVSGTMYGIANQGRAKNNLRAKSGGMTGVQAYAGYFTSLSGERLCFAIVVNRYLGEYAQTKAKLSAFLALMAESI